MDLSTAILITVAIWALGLAFFVERMFHRPKRVHPKPPMRAGSERSAA